MLRRLVGVVAVVGALFVGLGAAPSESPPERGCCSHHQGVCGCSGQRAMCCDGRPSQRASMLGTGISLPRSLQ
jgi:hypothetical protein